MAGADREIRTKTAAVEWMAAVELGQDSGMKLAPTRASLASPRQLTVKPMADRKKIAAITKLTKETSNKIS